MTEHAAFEITRQSHRTTINGVPVDRLDGHLPPPISCRDCGYEHTWFLIDPDCRRGSDGDVGELVMTAEYAAECVDPEMRRALGVLAMPPTCGHPYHLSPHICEPGKARLLSVLPEGLVVRA